MAIPQASRSSIDGPQASRGASGKAGVAAGLAVGVVAVVIAGRIGGAFDALAGFADGGALARWGLPIARIAHDVLGATTVGLLLLAGTIVPERSTTDRRARACRTATLTGAAWVVAGVVGLLLLVSNVSGVAVGEPGFAAQLAQVWDIELFRVPLLSVLVATAATAGASVARTRFSITWMAALTLVAFVLLALIGHAAGAAAHDTAVNSLAVHLAAAVVWFGGLAALLLLRGDLGHDLQVCVQRYSVLAAWCYGGIVVSGVLNAWVRLDGPAGLASTYGALVVAKAVLLVVLGVAGWRMRTSLIARLGEDARAFTVLAVGELALMGAAMGVGVAMSRSAPPVPQQASADIVTALTGYPAPPGPLTGWDWFTVVRIDWLWLAVVVLGIGLYAAGVARLHRRGDAWPWHRTAAWSVGWLFFFWVTSGAPGVYGRVQFSVHMLMHMALTMGIPLFLALGAPLTLAARALPARRDKTLGPRELLLALAHSRWMNFWANPVVAGINFSGSLYVFYFSGLFDLALSTHTGHIIMVVHFMLAGYVFSWALIGIDPGPKRWAPSLRLVLLFATMSFHAFFGIAIVSGTTVLAGEFFHQLALPWVPDLLADQKDGGLITWGIGEFPMLFLALAVGVVWMRADEQEARRRDRQAVRDHDAELEAYNAQLARRAEGLRAAQDAEDARALRRPQQRRHRAGSRHDEGA